MDVWFANSMGVKEKNAPLYATTGINSTKNLLANLQFTSAYLPAVLTGRFENSFQIAALHMICQSMGGSARPDGSREVRPKSAWLAHRACTDLKRTPCVSYVLKVES